MLSDSDSSDSDNGIRFKVSVSVLNVQSVVQSYHAKISFVAHRLHRPESKKTKTVIRHHPEVMEPEKEDERTTLHTLLKIVTIGNDIAVIVGNVIDGATNRTAMNGKLER